METDQFITHKTEPQTVEIAHFVIIIIILSLFIHPLITKEHASIFTYPPGYGSVNLICSSIVNVILFL